MYTTNSHTYLSVDKLSAHYEASPDLAVIKGGAEFCIDAIDYDVCLLEMSIPLMLGVWGS